MDLETQRSQPRMALKSRAPSQNWAPASWKVPSFRNSDNNSFSLTCLWSLLMLLTRENFKYWCFWCLINVFIYNSINVRLLTFVIDYNWRPRWLNGKESACKCRKHRRPRFNAWVVKIPWSRNGNPLQVSCLKNSMDRGEESSGLQSMGSQRVQHNWATEHTHTHT